MLNDNGKSKLILDLFSSMLGENHFDAFVFCFFKQPTLIINYYFIFYLLFHLDLIMRSLTLLTLSFKVNQLQLCIPNHFIAFVRLFKKKSLNYLKENINKKFLLKKN